MTPIISIYPGESVEHNWASTGERAWCCSWDLEEEGMLFLISFADCFPDSGWHWIIADSVQLGGVRVFMCITEWETRSMAFVSSRYRVLVGAIGWPFHCGVNFTLGSVCEARHTRLLAWTHMCVVSSDQRVKLNERSWERAERVWSKTCSHACLMKSG